MKIGVVIPWREQPSRLAAFAKVCEWYEDNLPEAKIYFVDNGNEVWEMSATRNLGVKLAEQDNCDVIIINDADTIPEINPLLESIDTALKDNMIHNPYNLYAFFPPNETRMHFEENIPLNKINFIRVNSCSGTIVFTPKAWWDLGGADEKFIKWGYEDTAQQLVHEVIHGRPFIKHFGVVYAFSHETQDSWTSPSQQMKQNEHLYNKYVNVARNLKSKEEILELVRSK